MHKVCGTTLKGSQPVPKAAFDTYITVVAGIISGRATTKLYLLSLGSLPHHELGEAVARIANPTVALYDSERPAFPVVLDPEPLGRREPRLSRLGTRAPYALAQQQKKSAEWTKRKLRRSTRSNSSAHKPVTKIATMPAPELRAKWWAGPPEGTYASTRNLER